MNKIQSLLAAQRPQIRFDLPSKALQRWQPELQAAAGDSSENTISILEPIGEDFWGDGVSAKRISAALRNIGTDNPVTVSINSPGGDVFEGLAIYSLLAEHRGPVTVKVLGLAASAASVIAMAGDTVQIAKAGFFMIHNSWTLAAGDRHFLREVGDWLEPFDDAMAGIYEERTGAAKSDLITMMDRESWINGEASITQGFADEYLGSDPVSASAGTDRAVVAAVRKMDIALAKAGMSRTERRSLINDFKSSTPGAAGGGTPGAATTNTPRAVVHAEPLPSIQFPL